MILAAILLTGIAIAQTAPGSAPTVQNPPAPPPANPSAQVPPPRPEDVGSTRAIVAALYGVISGPAGQKRDWNRFKSLFLPEARLMPTGKRPDGSIGYRVVNTDGYIERSAPLLERDGFFEREIGGRTEHFGNIAQVWSLYDSRRKAEDAQPFARGINSIQLFWDGKRWWIVSVMWDTERPDNPLPSELLETK